MAQLFQRLLGELKRLGVCIIHADFALLVVNTDKTDISAATEYTSFILRTLKTKELLQPLEVKMIFSSVRIIFSIRLLVLKIWGTLNIKFN